MITSQNVNSQNVTSRNVSSQKFSHSVMYYISAFKTIVGNYMCILNFTSTIYEEIHENTDIDYAFLI